MTGPVDILYEHAMPAWAIGTALVVAVAAFALTVWRYLRWDRTSTTIFVLRLLAWGVLGWCILLPVSRRTMKEMLRARFLVLLDSSASMKTTLEPGRPTRLEAARTVLNQPWTRQMAERCEIDVFGFSRELGARVSLDAARRAEADGAATHLRAALDGLFARHRGQPLAGVLVLSDGLDTREAGDAWAAQSWPCPIHTVRLEPPASAPPAPELRVDAAETPRRVVVGWNTKLTAVVSGQGAAGRPFAVRLYRNEEMLQELPTQLSSDGGSRDVAFPLDHPSTGVFTYRVFVPPLSGETETNDNVYSVTVQVVDAQNRLIYLEDVPRWESKYLNRALKAATVVTPLSFVRGPDGRFLTYGGRGGMTLDLSEEQLAGFKTVILGDLDAKTLTPERAARLAKFVNDGGNLVLLGGPRGWGANGFGASALKDVLPVRPGGSGEATEGRFPVVLTDEGRAHPVFAAKEGTAAWDRVPPVLTLFGGGTVTRGAQVLANAESPAGPQPLLAVQRFGQGKVVAILTDSLWRWTLEPGEGRPYERFWAQLLQWLTPEQEKTSAFDLDLFASSDRVFPGEVLDLSASLGGGNTPPGAAVTVEIQTPDGRRLPFPMAAQTITAGGKAMPGFAVKYTAEAAGFHKAIATTEVDGRKVESAPLSFFVQGTQAETRPRAVNVDLLKALAASSGGKFCEPAEVNAALAAVVPQGREEARVSYRSLWNNWFALAALVGILTLEWIVRRRANMA